MENCQAPKYWDSAQRVAVARLHLSDGRMLCNQLLYLSEKGVLLHHESLKKEFHSTLWYKGDWYEGRVNNLQF